MEETTQEFYKNRVQAQENRILELQQKNMDSNVNEQSIDLDYDLYLEHEYLFLNVNLPGVLKQELKVELNRGEIIISGEFPNLCADEEVEFDRFHGRCWKYYRVEGRTPTLSRCTKRR